MPVRAESRTSSKSISTPMDMTVNKQTIFVYSFLLVQKENKRNSGALKHYFLISSKTNGKSELPVRAESRTNRFCSVSQ